MQIYIQQAELKPKCKWFKGDPEKWFSITVHSTEEVQPDYDHSLDFVTLEVERFFLDQFK